MVAGDIVATMLFSTLWSHRTKNILRVFYNNVILYLHKRRNNIICIEEVIYTLLQEFEKQSEIMDMKEEMMNDSIDEAMEGDADEEERWAIALRNYCL